MPAGGRWRWAALGVGAATLWPALLPAIELSPTERNGQRLYTQGVTASGATITARVGTGLAPLPGHLLPCANCHGADAQGRPEGGVVPPAITWRELSKPYGHVHEGGNGRRHPAFDPASFARALTEGIDPAGNRLDPAMPRYTLASSDVADLLAYLQRIEDDRDPGLAGDRLRVATLLPRQGPLAGAGATVEAVLRGALAAANRGGGVHGRQLELVVLDAGSDGIATKAAWQRLLREADAFAVLAPLVPGQESELAALADAAGVPVVALPLHQPLAEVPRNSFYPVAGTGEQLRALVEVVRADARLATAPLAVMLPRGSGGREQVLAGQLELWLGRPLQRIEIAAGPADDRGASEVVAGVAAALQKQQVAGVFFLGRDTDLPSFMQAAERLAWQPTLLLPAAQSSSLLGGVPAAWEHRVFTALPSLPGDFSPAGREELARIREAAALPSRPTVLQAHVYAVAGVFLEALKRSGRATSRGRLVDALEGLHDFATGVSPPVAFGPGRRTGASGVHVLVPGRPGEPAASRFVRLDGDGR